MLDRACPVGHRQRRCVADPGPPEALGRLVGDLGRLLPVVAPMRHEVLEDHLLQMPVLGVHRGQRLERRDPIRLRLADPDEDPAA